MLFVLAGPSYVGKKTVMTHFMKLYSFSSIIPYTTKPERRRNGEVEGIKYHYVETENKDDIENDDFVYDKPFDFEEQHDDVLYAYKKRDIEQAIDSYSNFIIHASVGNAIQIYDAYHEKHKEHLYVIFLNYSTRLNRDMFKEKYIRIGLGNRVTENIQIEESELDRRYNHALKEQKIYKKNKKKFDEYIEAGQPYNACEKLQDYILPKLFVMPTSPDRIPGPLSDDDIIYMVENRKKDNLKVKIEEKELSKDEIIPMLSGCGIRLSLSSTIRKVNKRKLNNYIDMSADEHELEKILAKIYPEENISTGYILKPNEVILCSTKEEVDIPYDVYAVVAANFSYTQLGLSVELGTSIVQGGHSGKIHFQIKNNTENGICIYPDIQVVQLLFFRTVQPASKVYQDFPDSHSYDKERISPVSKFYQKNDRLKEVAKPSGNYIKSFFKKFREEMLANIIGIIVTGSGFIIALKEGTSYILDNLIRLIEGNSKPMQLFLLSIMVYFIGILFSIVGRVVMFLLSKGWWKIKEAMR